MEILARIYYKMKPTHPDYDCYVGGYIPETEISTDDVYRFSNHLEINDVEAMETDLALVAGGGYNTDHIYDVRYEFCTDKTEIAKWRKDYEERKNELWKQQSRNF